MAFVKADRVQERSITTGSGSMILTGAYDATFRTFDTVLPGVDTTFTCQCLIINESANNEWEVIEGTYDGSNNSLARTVVLSSSNSGAAVAFSSGTKRVSMLPPASAMVVEDNAGNVDIEGALTLGTALAVASGGSAATTTAGASQSLSTTFSVALVSDIDDLTLRPPVVSASGYATSGDGGGGSFVWIAGSVEAADGVIVISPTSGTAGRYKRIIPGNYQSSWWGTVGDDTANDTAALNAAFVAAAAAGVELRITAGTYSVTTLTVPTGSKISGVPGKSIIKARAAMTGPLLEAADDGDDISIDGLTLNGNSLANYGYFAEGTLSERHRITNLNISGVTDDGIRIRQASDLLIDRCVITTPGIHGITITTIVTNFVITNNIINNPGGAGVIFSQAIYGVISDNVITAAGATGDGITGYHVNNKHVTISGNVIKNTANHAIHVGGSYLTITGNTIDDTPANNGIMLWATTTGASTDPSAASNQCVIADNAINSTFRYGVYLENCHGCTVSGNTSNAASKYHYYFLNSTRLAITGNYGRTGLEGGYLFQGAVGCVATGNLSYNNAADGFRLAASAVPTSSTANTLTGNVSNTDNRGFIEAAAEADANYLSANRVVSSVSTAFIRSGASSVFDNVPLVGTATYDPASLADGAGVTTTVTVTGAALGDFAEASFSIDLASVMLTSWVSAVNTVSVRFQNESGGVVDLASGTIRAQVQNI